MLDAKGNVIAAAYPEYDPEEAPETAGWPLCRMPRVSTARVVSGSLEYTLHMQNSQNYYLEDKAGNCIMQIMHRGIMSGWDIVDMQNMEPEMLCGLFVFSRYIEQENEFMIV